MAESIFRVGHTDAHSEARRGMLALPHGTVETPAFMPVGTNGTVKAITSPDLSEIGFSILLANTYHLYLRPGADVIAQAGGLHHFINWPNNILTDSGGFQIYSLASMRTVTEQGYAFRSHIDGSPHHLSPEDVVAIQTALGSDIQMQLDVCTPWGIPHAEAAEALRITSIWLKRAAKAWQGAAQSGYGGALFGIVQGNFYKDLRKQSVEEVLEAGTAGIAIGGLSVGEEEGVFLDYLGYTASLLPQGFPRYVMGIGSPQYILYAIEQGIDMFDCVIPTRNARNGQVFTRDGPFALKKADNRMDFGPIDKECGCKICANYSRSYLRHLFKTQEILCSMLATYHNLYFMQDLVQNARQAIGMDAFVSFKKTFLDRYNAGLRAKPNVRHTDDMEQ